jgi:hypothetical protein
MQLTKQQFHQNLLATIPQPAPAANALQKECKFVIHPVYEPAAKYTSADDYVRLSILTAENIAARLFDAEGVATLLTGPNSSYPLWIEVVPKEAQEEYCLFELRISMRFRKPSELRNRETGHPPFKAIASAT